MGSISFSAWQLTVHSQRVKKQQQSITLRTPRKKSPDTSCLTLTPVILCGSANVPFVNDCHFWDPLKKKKIATQDRTRTSPGHTATLPFSLVCLQNLYLSSSKRKQKIDIWDQKRIAPSLSTGKFVHQELRNSFGFERLSCQVQTVGVFPSKKKLFNFPCGTTKSIIIFKPFTRHQDRK